MEPGSSCTVPSYFTVVSFKLSSHLRLDLASYSFLEGFPTKTLCAFSLPHMCLILNPYYSFKLISLTYILRSKIMNILLTQFSPVSCYCLPLEPEYLPHHAVLMLF